MSVNLRNTIFAPLCPLGGSIVVVRISGADAFNFFQVFDVKADTTKHRDVFFATLKYEGQTFDEVIINIFKAPNTFTGEDIVEVSLHASKLILQDFLEILSKIPNFRFATNGEFSRRAFLNGKMSIIKSEGINAIIRAKNRKQQRLASALFCGDLQKQYENLRQKIINVRSLVEASIDFAEDEVPQDIADNVENIVVDLKTVVKNCLNTKNNVNAINNGVLVAIIGEPNVGKSSLINKFANRNVAIVSSIAGTTRDVLTAEIDLDGYFLKLFDTAGIRETSDEIEKEGVKRANDVAKNADIQVILLDASKDVEYNKTLLKQYKSQYPEGIFVINKVDLKNYDSNFEGENIIEISTKTSEGLDELKSKILDKTKEIADVNTEFFIANERQAILMNECLTAFERIDLKNMPIEIVGEELKTAENCISQIVGTIYTDDILDNIFSKFCIGK